MRAEEQLQGNEEETYTFDLLDLEMIGCVHEEVRKQLRSKTVEAMSHSNFYTRLQEQSEATHHREPEYWAEYIVAQYRKQEDVELDIDLVEKAVEMWQQLWEYEDESKFHKFKLITDRLFQNAIEDATKKFNEMTEDYQKTIHIGLRHGIPIAMIAKATDITERELLLIANTLGYKLI